MLTIEQARLWYTGADAVHDFDHVLRVTFTANRIGKLEGADLEILRAAALLHDAEGASPGPGSKRLGHQHASAEFAGRILKEEGWPDERIAAVQHCIRAHRYRDHSEPPASLEARILFDADKLDVLGAIGAARVIAYAALDGNPFYFPPSDKFLRTGREEPAEPHSAYHEHLFKLRYVSQRMFTASAKAMAAERLAYLEGFFERLIAEWQGEK